jgi:hypothetical protein
LELSENPEAYKFYFKHFLKCVIPPTTFKNCLRQDPRSLSSKVDRLARGKEQANNLVEFVTEAEETLGLFILDNFSHVWQAQLTQEEEETNKEEANVVFPKYTKAKKSALVLQKSTGVHVAPGKRLSDDGTLRWNELSLKVAADRARPERTAWEQEVLGEMAAEALSGKKRRYEKATQVPPSTVRLHVSIPGWMTTG